MNFKFPINTFGILFIIILLAAFLRFYQIGTNPPSLTWDEVAWGYNAYSLGIDGKDEFGKFLPITYLESFGDFKPPVYAYLDILPVKIFGLSEFAVRFPSAFFGTLTVLLTYFLVKGLFYKSPNVKYYSLFSSFVLAVSPWHIMISRAAFEANVATCFIVSGMTFFLYWIKKKKIFFICLSVLSFVLSLYTFNSARVVSPLLFVLLSIGFWKILWQRKKEVLFVGIIGLVLVSPLIPFLLSPQASLRYREVNIFTDPSIVENSNQEIANDGNIWWSKIIHNRRLGYSLSYVKHYLDNLSPQFLFIKGDGNPKFSTQDVGQLYLWSLPFFVFGTLLLFRKREGYWWIVPIWLLLSIIPAAVARETPHALRIESSLPTFQILEAYGFFHAFIFFRKHFKKIVGQCLIIVCGLIYLLNIAYFIHGYYMHYAWLYSEEWQYGYKESISYVSDHEKQFDKIAITNALGRPYVYYLFYLKTPPEFFINNSKVERDVFGFVNVKEFGKYSFANNVNDLKFEGQKVLYINDTKKIPHNAHVLKTFYLENGNPVLAAYTK